MSRRRVHAVRFSDGELAKLAAAVPFAKVRPSRKEKATVGVLIREASLLLAELLTQPTVENARADLARQLYSLMLGGTLLDRDPHA